MNGNTQITDRQAVELTRDILTNIQIPAGLVVQIGLPISDAIANLNAVLEAWNKAPAEPNNAEEVNDNVQSEPGNG